MFKKIVCLALCLLMIVPMLVACKKEDAVSEIIDEASKSTQTLNVWLMAGADMDAAQAAKVAEAINKLTKAKFKTKLNIKFLPEDQYYAAVEAAFTWEDENAANRAKTASTGTTGYLNEYGMVELNYPEIPENEVDILFIGDFEKYSTYINNKWLAVLDGQLQEHQELSYTINPTLLTAARYNKQVYAIPNNHGAGHYTYLLADTALLEEYGSFADGTTLYDTAFQNFLDYIYRTYNDPADKIYPLYSKSGDIDLEFAHYWSFAVDDATGEVSATPETFSIFGDNFLKKTQLGNVNLLGDRDYMRALAAKVYYENTEGYITTDENARYAVRVVKGDLAEKRAFEAAGYTVIQMEGPTLRNEDVYSSMFAVGARSASIERSVEILTYLNTDEEIRNLLQYGIRDVNYTLSTRRTEDGLEYPYVTILPGNGYHMDVEKTGNLFLAYPVGSENALQWNSAKEQNLEISKYAGLGIHLDQTIYHLDLNNVRIMTAVSAGIKTYLDGLTTSTQVMSLCNLIASVAAADDANMSLATCLLDITGPVSYTKYTDADNDGVPEGAGVVTAITAADLATALTAYQATDKPVNRSKLYAPYQLYLNWCSASGVTVG